MAKVIIILLAIFALYMVFRRPSAMCRDGSYSYSWHRRGTCSGHGGVAQWR